MSLRISVITPNFNGAQTLQCTIDSVLSQEIDELEYIVIDGGSTDGSVSILEAYHSRLAHVLSEPDQGQYDAIAKGIALATGEILCWINSDDSFPPWALRVVKEIFTRHPDVDWITGVPCLIRDRAIQSVSGPALYPRDLVLGGAYHEAGLGSIMQECTFWKTRLYNQAGGINTRYKLAGDFDLWTRFARHSPLVSTTAMLGSFTWTGRNRSLLHAQAYGSEVATIRAGLDAQTRNAADRLIQKKKRFEARCFRHPWARELLSLPHANEHREVELLQFIPETGLYKKCTRHVRFDQL
jgi:glycosyltransferase involved in cell wall biosynthesis